MNIAFFLTPKSEVVWVSSKSTLGQALERMRPNQFTAVPILNEEGGDYVGTLTEGDALWHLLNTNSKPSETLEAISKMRWRQINEGEALNTPDAKRKICPPYPARAGRFSSDPFLRYVLATTPLLAVSRRITYHAVHIDADVEELVNRAVDQNFVPVIDDRGVFIGIVRRKSIIQSAQRVGMLRRLQQGRLIPRGGQ
jgi:CBS domain-containing protein